MGRSVSTPTNAIVAFGYLEVDTYRCESCGETFNEYGSQDEEACCPNCAAPESETHNQLDFAYQDDFEWVLETFKGDILKAFASAYEDDRWLDREDHAVASNKFAYFGISEYCGTIALWMAPKDADWREGPGWEGLRDHWLAQATPKFRKLAEGVLPNPMRRLGVMSNGEAVYQRVA